MERRDLAVSLARGRIAIGVVSLVAPGFVGRTITGRNGSEGGTRLFLRMVGHACSRATTSEQPCFQVL